VFRFLVNNNFLRDFDPGIIKGVESDETEIKRKASEGEDGGEGEDKEEEGVAGADVASKGEQVRKKGVDDLWMFPWVDDPERGKAAMREKLKKLAQAADAQEDGDAAMDDDEDENTEAP
jgi:hypothetical protein